MNSNLKERLQKLCDIITAAKKEILVKQKLDCEVNLNNAVARYSVKKKYVYIDVGRSGMYMVELATERIYGIKGYGVVNRLHYYGTIDSPDSFIVRR